MITFQPQINQHVKIVHRVHGDYTDSIDPRVFRVVDINTNKNGDSVVSIVALFGVQRKIHLNPLFLCPVETEIFDTIDE